MSIDLQIFSFNLFFLKKKNERLSHLNNTIQKCEMTNSKAMS